MKEFYLCDRTEPTPIQTFDAKRIHYITRTRHTHKGLEMTYVTSGSARHTIFSGDGEVLSDSIVRRGNYFVIGAGTYHSYHDGSPDFAVINLLAKPAGIDPRLSADSTVGEIEKILLFGSESSKRIPFDTVCYDYRMTLGQLFEQILKIKYSKPAGMLGFYRAYVMEILLTMLNRSGDPGRRRGGNIAENVKDYIDVHFSEQITLNEICGMFHYAQPYVSRRFRETNGCTFEQYLQRVRMMHACDLLIETDLSIEKISEAVSYLSSSPFRRTFKNHFGISPKEYRNRHSAGSGRHGT